MRTAIQLYTLRVLDEPLTQTLDRVADTPLDGAEFSADGATDEAVREKLDETGLRVPSLGVDPKGLEDVHPRLIDACEAVGCDRFVLGYLGPEYFESRETAIETADRVSEYVANVAEHGLDLCYHNHAHEFTDLDDRTAFDVFVDHVDDRLLFELDLGWIGTGGDDPAARLTELGDRTPLVHVKDMQFETGAFADLGAGDLNLEDVLRTAREQDVEWAIYEHDEPDDPLNALERDSRTLVDAVDTIRSD